MQDLDLSTRREFIEELVSKHIVAIVELVNSKEEIGGKLGRARWGGDMKTSLLQFPEHITADEIEDCLLALAIRGLNTGHQCLTDHADEIRTSDEFLTHLVLHEIAHVKHDWRQDKETDCDLWVYAQMHEKA